MQQNNDIEITELLEDLIMQNIKQEDVIFLKGDAVAGKWYLSANDSYPPNALEALQLCNNVAYRVAF